MKKILPIILSTIFIVLTIFFAFWIYDKKIRRPHSLIYLKTPCETAIFNEPNSRQIYLTLKFKNAGVFHNSEDKHGISALVSKLLFRKIGELSAEETEEKIQQLGITNLFTRGTTDDFIISFSIIEEQFESAVKFLISGLNKKFSENDLTFSKEFFPVQISSENSHPDDILLDKLYQKLYPNHIYGKNSTGSSSAISTITLNDINLFIKNNFALDNLKIYYTGSYSKEKLKILIDELSKFLPKKSNQRKIPDLKNIAVDNSEEKISNNNIRDICGVMTGIRMDNLSKQEKATLLVVADTLFNRDDGNFRSDECPTDFSYTIEDRELSTVLILSSFVHQKDCNGFVKKLNDFLSELDVSQLKNLELSQNYFVEKQNRKMYSLRSVHSSLNFLSMPFSDCDDEIYQQILNKIKQPKFRCTVIISSK
ncbi:MAG: insulinase family protein [Alphaproteobacteria bacterium]|nr:insulinase family protein [Alphaproteobacteria bacterium]